MESNKFNQLILLLLIIIAKSYAQLVNSSMMDCDDQIISNLSSQNIKYSIKQSIIEIDVQDGQDLQFDLVIKACVPNKKLRIQSNINLTMKELIVENVQSKFNRYIEFLNLASVNIQLIQLFNACSQYGSIINIQTIKFDANNLSCEGNSNVTIKAKESIQINTLNNEMSEYDQTIQVYLESYVDININNLIIKNNVQVINMYAKRAINIDTLSTSCSQSEINIIMISSQIYIQQFELGCSTSIKTVDNEYMESYTNLLQIKKIIKSKDIILSEKLFYLSLNSYLENLIIGELQMDTYDFYVFLKICYKNIVTIGKISLDFTKVELKDNFNPLINMQIVGTLKIDQLILNGSDTLIKQSFATLKEVDNVEIKELIINGGQYKNNLINSQTGYTLKVYSLSSQNVYFESSLFYLYDIKDILFTNLNLIIDETMSWIQKNVAPIQKENSWRKIYYPQDGARSFIHIEMNKELFLYNDINQISIKNAVADFSGFQSRFLNVFLYRNYIHLEKLSLSNMYSHQNGGCIRIENSLKASIRLSKFINCKSEKFGGALYGLSFLLTDITFSNSDAKFGGAIARQMDNEFDDQLIFNNNEAQIEPNQFIYSAQFSINSIYQYVSDFNQTIPLIHKEVKQQQYWNIMPGIQYIIVLDYIFDNQYGFKKRDKIVYDGIFTGNLYSYLQFKNQDLLISQSDINSQISLDIIQKKPYIIVQALSNANKFNKIKFDYFLDLDSDINMPFSDCSAGQQKISVSKNVSEGYFCRYCPFMSANYESNQFECTQCDRNLFSTCFANYSAINGGYWRSSLTLDKTQVYPCKNSIFSCAGGYGYGDSLCTEGKIGIECSSCDESGRYWNSTYSKSGLYSCTKCSDISNNSIKIIILIICFILILFLAVHSNSKKTSNIIYQQYLSKMNLIYVGSSFKKLGLSSVYIKVLSFNSSMIGMIQNQIDFSIKDTLLKASMQYTNPLEVSFASIDCFLSSLSPELSSIGIQRLYFYLTIPLIITPATLLLPTIKFILKRMSKRFFYYILSLILIYTLFIVFYNPILSACLDSILCKTFQNGESKSLIDLTISCEKAQKQNIIPILGLLFYGGFVPFIIITGLIKNRNRLNKISILFKYGFLYSEYHEKYFYWELVRFSMKVLQLIIQKVFLSQIELMNNLNILALVIYLALIIKYKPFQRSFLNSMEAISVLIVLINFLGINIYSSQRNNQNGNNLNAEYLLIGCLVIAFIFSIYLSIIIILSFLEAYILKLQKYRLFKKFIKHSPFFTKYTYSSRTHANFKKLRSLVINRLYFNKNNHQIQEQSTLISHFNLEIIKEKQLNLE